MCCIIAFHPSVVFHIETINFKLESAKMFLKRFSQQKSRAIQETAFYERVSLQSPSNVERLRDIQHSMGLVLDTRFHIWFIMTLYYNTWQILQNATALLLQNASGFLLQNTTVLLQKCDSYWKLRRFITKRDVYCKLRQYKCH